MNIQGKSIEIKCRRCGKTAKAEDFILDYVYKMAVCPSCVKERKANDSKTIKQSIKEAEAPHEEAPKKQNPPGWDAEDEYLEKLERQKQGGSVQESQTPKPYQMGGLGRTSPYNQPKPQTPSQTSSLQSSKPMSVSDFVMRSTTKPSPSQEPQRQPAQPQSKPMDASSFGMRASAKPAEHHAEQSSQSSKPMDMASFGMRSTHKAEESHDHQEKSAIATEREGKSSSDPDKMKYKCKKCGYEFYYNRERNVPRACPYCNTQVMHLI